ncbi:hypothetical protein BLNAU_14085 [Blattamonas nauphoetae]|uniref:Uncharacterized protein n=1 Tax=Blattamonas nauphoetae TaxID=2049346 RepID=A0ABQ9XEV6_9EUKA|nr:hypothetical protein BLNAU_14085 [Blattamonas nauphoetae]
MNGQFLSPCGLKLDIYEIYQNKTETGLHMLIELTGANTADWTETVFLATILHFQLIPDLDVNQYWDMALNFGQCEQLSSSYWFVTSLDASSGVSVSSQPVLDVSLEVKAVKFLEYVVLKSPFKPNAFLHSFALPSDDYSTAFVESIVVLVSSVSPAITTAAMNLLQSLLSLCSIQVRYTVIKADLIPKLMNTLNPLSLSFAEKEKIHIALIKIISGTFFTLTPDCIADLKIEDPSEQQDVHGTVFKQVLAPSEKYICHFCVNCHSIVDGDLPYVFLTLLARLICISPYYQPTMDFVLHTPIIPAIPCCLPSLTNEHSTCFFLDLMFKLQREWNGTIEDAGQMWNTVLRMLRMEGFEDVMEEKLRNDLNGMFGRWIVESLIDWNNLQGMNPPPNSTRPTSALRYHFHHSTRGSICVLLHSPPSLPVFIASTPPSSPSVSMEERTSRRIQHHIARESRSSSRRMKLEVLVRDGVPERHIVTRLSFPISTFGYL